MIALIMQSLLWQGSTAFLISSARRKFKQLVWMRVRPFSLTPPQFGVLLTIKAASDISLAALAGELGIDAPTACRIVSNLTRRGLIKSHADPDDRRRFRL